VSLIDCVHVAWKMRARDSGRALGKEKARLVPANLPCFGTVFKRAAFELDYRRAPRFALIAGDRTPVGEHITTVASRPVTPPTLSPEEEPNK